AGERPEPSVVIEAALRSGEEAAQRSGAVHSVRGAAGLEIVDADLSRGVQVPSRLRVRGRHMAARAIGREDLLAAIRGGPVEASGGRSRRVERELVFVQRGK